MNCLVTGSNEPVKKTFACFIPLQHAICLFLTEITRRAHSEERTDLIFVKPTPVLFHVAVIKPPRLLELPLGPESV